jgi:hypothetical protein
MFFLGFPGETREEAEATLGFVARLRGPITHVAFSNFILEHRSPVYRQPERYGICEVLPYAGEDLKIYSDYRVAEGMPPEEAIALLEEARERPGIRPLIDLYLVSRTHLAFLPPLPAAAAEEAPVVAEPAGAGLPEAGAEHLFPRRADDLVPRSLAFDLDEVRRRLADAAADPDACPPVPRRPSHYVFSPRRERLLDVGDDGLRLLAPCDGRYSLAQILAAVGEEGRGNALDFYCGLAAQGVLRWEVRP